MTEALDIEPPEPLRMLLVRLRLLSGASQLHPEWWVLEPVGQLVDPETQCSTAVATVRHCWKEELASLFDELLLWVQRQEHTVFGDFEETGQSS